MRYPHRSLPFQVSFRKLVFIPWVVGVAGLAMLAWGVVPADSQLSTPSVAAVDAVFKDMNQPGMPGCVVDVFRGGVEGGGTLLSRSYGLAELENGVPLTMDSRMDIASMTKQFTAMDVLLLASRHKLSLDDDVRNYVPELPKYEAPITIQDLIHQTSGLKDLEQLLDVGGWHGSTDRVTMHDAMSMVTRQRELNFAPGTQFAYSNTNYLLLGVIVERVSGSTLSDFTQQNIFVPLGMSHTILNNDPSRVVPRRAFGYGFIRSVPRAPRSNWETIGAGGMLTTAGDLELWDQNFYDGKVGGHAVLEEMVRTRKLRDGKPNGYAAGLEVNQYRGLRTVEHDGESYGAASDLLRFPDQHLSVILLCNRADADVQELTRAVADLYLPKPPSPESAGVPDKTVASSDNTSAKITSSSDLNAFAGAYWSSDLKLYRNFVVRDGALVDLEIGSKEREIGDSVFVSSSGTVYTFHRGQGDQVGLTAKWAITRGSFEHMLAPETSPAALQAYSGEYVSDDLGTAWCIYARDNNLLLRRGRFEDVTLAPRFKDGFEGDYAYLLFQREGSRIVGISVENFRLKSVAFRKLSKNERLNPQPWTCP
jgi:CubicO group peptidase (beta-lactamase class C family)